MDDNPESCTSPNQMDSFDGYFESFIRHNLTLFFMILKPRYRRDI